ncbi:unnamed protein product [Arctogadus glacialis]
MISARADSMAGTCLRCKELALRNYIPCQTVMSPNAPDQTQPHPASSSLILQTQPHPASSSLILQTQPHPASSSLILQTQPPPASSSRPSLTQPPPASSSRPSLTQPPPASSSRPSLLQPHPPDPASPSLLQPHPPDSPSLILQSSRLHSEGLGDAHGRKLTPITVVTHSRPTADPNWSRTGIGSRP